MGKRDDVELPKNYYYHDDPNEEPLVTWRAHANLFIVIGSTIMFIRRLLTILTKSVNL